jgi:hypothetical protein
MTMTTYSLLLYPHNDWHYPGGQMFPHPTDNLCVLYHQLLFSQLSLINSIVNYILHWHTLVSLSWLLVRHQERLLSLVFAVNLLWYIPELVYCTDYHHE